MTELDLRELGLRAINSQLNALDDGAKIRDYVITNPAGQHAMPAVCKRPLM